MERESDIVVSRCVIFIVTESQVVLNRVYGLIEFGIIDTMENRDQHSVFDLAYFSGSETRV